MKIKRIEFMDGITVTDVHNDNIDFLVENEDDYNYIIGVGTPQNLLEENHRKKTNKRNCYGSHTSLCRRHWILVKTSSICQFD